MRRALLVFGLTLFVYVLTASGHLYSPDEEVMFRMTRALARGEGLAVDPLRDGFATRPANPPRTDHREYAQYGIGQPLLAVPLYAAGVALSHFAHDALWQRIYPVTAYPPEALGFAPTAAELAPRFAVSWFNAIVGAGLALLVYLLCLELLNHRRAATWAAFLYAFGSLAWPHSRPFFSESLAAGFLLFAFYRLLCARRRGLWLNCLLAGAATGYAFLVRMDSLFAYPALALLLLGPVAHAARGWPRTLAAWIVFALPALACAAAFMALNKIHFGSLFALGYSDQSEGIAFKSPIAAGLYGLLCSPGKGLFFFSPVLLLGLWGWSALAERIPSADRKWIVGAIAAAIIIPLVAHAKWINWAGGWCWGPRHIFGIHPFLAIPVAAWVVSVGPATRRIVCTVMLVIGIAVQLLGVSQDFIRFYLEFFRSPGQPTMFFIRYDDIDRQYWDQFYSLTFRFDPAQPPRSIQLFPPAPIQDSIYVPQRGVWSGYPLMWRMGLRDNFWLNLLSRTSGS